MRGAERIWGRGIRSRGRGLGAHRGAEQVDGGRGGWAGLAEEAMARGEGEGEGE